MKSNRERILQTEWDLLGVLWDQGAGTTRTIAEALEEKRGWAYTTVKTLLDRMVAKGLVRSRRVGNVYEYSAAVAPEEARRGAWKRFLHDAFGGSIDPALRFIAEDAELSPKQQERLRKLLEEMDGE